MRVNGNALRALRTRRGLTQRNLAAHAGIHYSYVSLLEHNQRGTTHVDRGIIAALADGLGVPVKAIAMKGDK